MGLEQSLNGAFGAVAVVEIVPLRRVDVAAIAAAWCDSSPFLEEVEQAGAGPLAARPLTLRFLARTFGESGTLPERGAALYAAGIRSLCEEQNSGRRDAGLDGVLSLDERIAVARRIAAATVFAGALALWTGPELDAGMEDIALEGVAGSAEPTPGGAVALTVPAVREAARTGLFTSRGSQRLGWAQGHLWSGGGRWLQLQLQWRRTRGTVHHRWRHRVHLRPQVQLLLDEVPRRGRLGCRKRGNRNGKCCGHVGLRSVLDKPVSEPRPSGHFASVLHAGLEATFR